MICNYPSCMMGGQGCENERVCDNERSVGLVQSLQRDKEQEKEEFIKWWTQYSESLCVQPSLMEKEMCFDSWKAARGWKV